MQHVCDDTVENDRQGPYRYYRGRAELCELIFETRVAAEIPGMLLLVLWYSWQAWCCMRASSARNVIKPLMTSSAFPLPNGVDSAEELAVLVVDRLNAERQVFRPSGMRSGQLLAAEKRLVLLLKSEGSAVSFGISALRLSILSDVPGCVFKIPPSDAVPRLTIRSRKSFSAPGA